MVDELSHAAVNRSGFVTSLAWIFIALAGFATLISVLQNIMVALMFPGDEMRAAIRHSKDAQPAIMVFAFENFRYLVAGFLVLSAGTLISAIGLLRRWNWARLVFIAVMAFGVLWNLSALPMAFYMSSLMTESSAYAPSDFDHSFKLMWNIVSGVSVAIALAVAGLFAWIIKRLVSEDIRREFVGAS